jgi:hypothetical protein
VDADILAAGHPELIFELDGQCVTQPKHWQETTNWNGAQAWAVGQAVALREMTWQLANEKPPTENQINRRASLIWLHASAAISNQQFTVNTSRTNASYYEQWADLVARQSAEINWSNWMTHRYLSALANASEAFRESSISQPLQARRAERLVLALDRLTLALPDAKAAEQLRAPLKKLFADVQSLPDFAPATFADHLAEFQKALPADSADSRR